MTAEQLVDNAILQKGKKYKIGGVAYYVAPPSVGTLISISSHISEQINAKDVPDSEALTEALKAAKGSKIGDIAATLVLGARGVKSPPVIREQKSFFGLRTKKIYADYEKIKECLLLDWRPQEIHQLIIDCLSKSEFGFFLGSTIFLSEVNMTKPTKTIPHGQS